MAISKVEDPATGGELTIIKGVVERITFKEAVNDRYGNTHRASVLVDGEWVGNISLKTKEGYDPQVRFNNGNNAKPDWQTLEVGDEARFVVTENPYNGKVYYNGGTSKIKLVKKGAGTPAGKPSGNPSNQSSSKPAQQASQVSYKRDDTQVVAGNARTAAFAFLKGKPYKKVVEVNELVEKFAILSDAKRKEYKAANPSLDDFQVGVSVGQSVVLAAGIAKSFEDVGGIVDEILEQVIPYSVQVVKDVADGKYNEPEPDDYQEPEESFSDDELDGLPF